MRATHHFLDEADVVFDRPLVADMLSKGTLDLRVLTNHKDAPLGFIGLAPNAIEALFMDPAYRGQGYGRLLVAHAQERVGGALAVDVNEQNAAARGFYEALGFVVVGRSPLDDTGRLHPSSTCGERHRGPTAPVRALVWMGGAKCCLYSPLRGSGYQGEASNE